MKLITNEQQAQLRANGLAAGEALSRGSDIDPMPVVKLFTPDADIIWLITELNAYGGDRAYGLCELGDGYPGIGFFYLFELEYPQCGIDVVRDVDFVANKPLSAYIRDVRMRRHIAI